MAKDFNTSPFSLRVGHQSGGHTYLMLVNDRQTYLPPVQELHFYPGKMSPRLGLLSAAVYQTRGSGLAAEAEHQIIDQGESPRLMGVWYRACRVAAQIRDMGLPFDDENCDCRAGVATTLDSLGYDIGDFRQKSRFVSNEWKNIRGRVIVWDEPLPNNPKQLWNYHMSLVEDMRPGYAP